MAQRGVILSGMRPTGALHLGNLHGALSNWVRLQDDYECYFEIADWHAITDRTDTSQLESNVRAIALDWLAAGLDPTRCVIFRQSDVKEHAELHLLLSFATPVGWLERVPTYKDQIKELALGDNVSYAFLGYPVLQAADILLYRADTVPVGKDQVAHLELSREIARRFNHLFGNVFPEPQALVNEAALTLLGTDGRKMSKSYNNTIAMQEPDESLKKKLQGMFTDPKKLRRGDPGTPEICPVFALQRLYSPARVEGIAAGCRSGALGCSDCKAELLGNLQPKIKAMRDARAHNESGGDGIGPMLAAGAEKARARARETMHLVRSAMRLPE